MMKDVLLNNGDSKIRTALSDTVTIMRFAALSSDSPAIDNKDASLRALEKILAFPLLSEAMSVANKSGVALDVQCGKYHRKSGGNCLSAFWKYAGGWKAYAPCRPRYRPDCIDFNLTS